MSRPQSLLLLSGTLLLLCLFALSLATGAGEYGPRALLGYLFGDPALRQDPQFTMILHTLRLPRTLCALLVGVCVALSATLLQSATRNPLAEPGLLGVNAGAVLALVVGITWFGVESAYGYLLWSGLGALLANLIVLALGLMLGGATPLKLILVGVALSATFGGLANYLLLSNLVVLEQFRFWNLGSLAASSLDAIGHVTPFVVLALILSLLLCRPLTLLQMGDLQARALGIHPALIRVGVLLASTLFIACAIAIAGPIAFVGFLAAYCARLVEPVRLAVQIRFSALFGVLFLLLADLLARVLIRPFEMPSGILLALIGAPTLIVVVQRGGFRSLLAVK
ncbi:FecCD family ABC transporter permease [Aeromonas simiae]|uniref:Iron ABC transporter permease n=1 Tax=Aeromonas simiae TaxID=218936 RepID=A0A5J6WTP8_9GAMM|nr:iron ABC transporter permease [Aeromonas simiae]QFI54526.1 iron ABC transporter permease [Aeromonas simiae]